MFADERAESLAVFRDVDRVDRRSPHRYTGVGESFRELERRLSAELHDHPFRLLEVDDLQHVLERQRLEVEAIRRVVVGRHRLRIAVDHDRFEAGFSERE